MGKDGDLGSKATLGGTLVTGLIGTGPIAGAGVTAGAITGAISSGGGGVVADFTLASSGLGTAGGMAAIETVCRASLVSKLYDEDC